ncbi:hypothetical protein [Streptomyces sp. NPDC047070]|uniref:hypothetical protein n=1 Tax=Streptomyces sp. NPDC047070 TaxID=3154923 RepID=UPI003451ED61
MNECWERVAQLLKSERLSNPAVAERCGVTVRFAARVRADLGLPAYHYRRQMWSQAEFDSKTILLRGGHRVWRGRVSRDGTPMASRDESAYRIGFRLHHGREAVGPVRGTCTKKWCVAGAHRTDKVMRDEAAARGLTELPTGATWRGLDLTAVRRALYGKEPYPELSVDEKKLAARFAGSLSQRELARRLDCCPRSAKAWREQVIPV